MLATAFVGLSAWLTFEAQAQGVVIIDSAKGTISAFPGVALDAVTINVDGAGSLTTTGQVTVGGPLRALSGADFFFSDIANVATLGASTVNSDTVNSGTIAAGTLTSSGNATLGDSAADKLTVKATSTFDATATFNAGIKAGTGDFTTVTAGTLTSTGKATLDSLEVGKNAEVKGNLTVGGNLDMTGGDIANVGKITAGTGSFTGITTGGLGVSGNAVLGNSPADTLTVNANSTFNGFANFKGGALVEGGLTVENANLTVNGGSLTMVGGDILAVGNLGVQHVFAGTITTTGDVKIGGNLDMGGGTITNVSSITTTTLTTTGKATLNALEVTNNAEVKGSLTVAKGATVSESFAVTPGSTISMGGNRVQDVAAPILDTDAANKGYVDAGLAKAFKDINRNTEGVALAMAMAGTPTLLPMENFALTANWGQFEGAHGLAAGFALRLDSNIQFNGGVAYGPSENTVGTRAGIRIGW